MLKKSILITMTVIASLSFAGCKSEVETSKPANVSNFFVRTGNGCAFLYWTNPEDPNFTKVVISYDDDCIRVPVEGSSNTKTIFDLTNGKKTTFTLFAVYSDGSKSDPISRTIIPTNIHVGDIVHVNSEGIYLFDEGLLVNKGTPIGVVISVNARGFSKVVSLKQEYGLVWASSDALGRNKYTNLDTTRSTGYDSWEVLCDFDSVGTSVKGKYPAFEYCNSLNDGNNKWFLPSDGEVEFIFNSRSKINSQINLINNFSTSNKATLLDLEGKYMSSIEHDSNGLNINVYDFKKEKLDYFSKEYKDIYTRAIANF